MRERHGGLSVAQIAGALIFVALSVESDAQSVSATRPEFEAATARASRDGSSGVRATTGRLTLENVSLRALVCDAYKTKPSQIVGGPSWKDSAMFNVEGKAGEAAGTDMMLLMLQSLLKDRFQLKMHHETERAPSTSWRSQKAATDLKRQAIVSPSIPITCHFRRVLGSRRSTIAVGCREEEATRAEPRMA